MHVHNSFTSRTLLIGGCSVKQTEWNGYNLLKNPTKSEIQEQQSLQYQIIGCQDNLHTVKESWYWNHEPIEFFSAIKGAVPRHSIFFVVQFSSGKDQRIAKVDY